MSIYIKLIVFAMLWIISIWMVSKSLISTILTMNLVIWRRNCYHYGYLQWYQRGVYSSIALNTFGINPTF